MVERLETGQLNPLQDAMTSNSSSPVFASGSHASVTTLENLVAHIPESYIVTLSGGLAGAASGIVGCPLDVIKTKLQAQGGFRLARGRDNPALHTAAYRGVKGTAQRIWTEEGVRGMYRGLGPMLLGYIPTWAVYLTVYNESQTFFNQRTDNKFMANVYSSLVGGTCSTLVTNPIWVIKTRLMSQSSSRTKAVGAATRAPWYYRNTLDAARKMYKYEGILSFYSGLIPALFGLTHVAVQFPLYEVLKNKFTPLQPGESEGDIDKIKHFYGLSLAVFCSKVIASTATYPHEVVRTRLQTQQRSHPHLSAENLAYRGNGDPGKAPGTASSDGMVNQPRYRGTIQTCKTIMAEEGWKGFYAGLGTNLIRAVPSAMTTILTFEYLKKELLADRESGRSKLGLL